jgi:hypothetical protein
MAWNCQKPTGDLMEIYCLLGRDAPCNSVQTFHRQVLIPEEDCVLKTVAQELKDYISFKET